MTLQVQIETGLAPVKARAAVDGIHHGEFIAALARSRAWRKIAQNKGSRAASLNRRGGVISTAGMLG